MASYGLNEFLEIINKKRKQFYIKYNSKNDCMMNKIQNNNFNTRVKQEDAYLWLKFKDINSLFVRERLSWTTPYWCV